MAVQPNGHILCFLEALQYSRKNRKKLFNLVKENPDIVKAYLDTLSEYQRNDPDMKDIYFLLEKIVEENLNIIDET